MIYSSCDRECKRLKLEIMGHFLPFYPLPKNSKNQNFEKMKKNSGYIITLHMCTKNHNHSTFGPICFLLTPLKTWKMKILKKNEKSICRCHHLYMCTKNHDHMMYASCDMECDRHNFLSFGSFFMLFSQLLTPKIKIWKKCNKCLVILSFFRCVPKMKIIWCKVPETQGITEFFTILGHLLPFDPHNNLKNQNFETMKKIAGRYHFTLMYHKWQSHGVWFLRHGAWQTEYFDILDYFLPFYPP